MVEQKNKNSGPTQVDLVIDNRTDSTQARKLLEENGIKVRIVHSESQPVGEPPYPWLISASNGSFIGLDGVRYYIEVFGGTTLVY